MQIERGTGKDWIGASLSRTPNNDLIGYVQFADGGTVTFDPEFYIVRGNINANDKRIDAAAEFIAPLFERASK